MAKKIAIVADWLTNLGGAERVVEQLHSVFPTAPIYTSLYRPEKLPQFADADVRTSWLQRVPGARYKHQLFLPLYPMVFESFDLGEYDIVISSSFACAKGVITRPDQLHICYCHNPTRYFWDESHEFWQRYNLPRVLKWLGSGWVHNLRQWDRVAAERPDLYLANSEFVARRIGKYYGKEAQVLYPGIEMPVKPRFKRQDFYLAAGRLTAQKYFDLVVEAFNRLQLPLKIVGEGPALSSLQKMNRSSQTEFLGFVSDEELHKLYSQARALVFPQCEDFGVVPLEAQSYGCPVIAYGAGGALETVYAGKGGGLLFEEQTVDALVAAVAKFERRKPDSDKIREEVMRFDVVKFKNEIIGLVGGA